MATLQFLFTGHWNFCVQKGRIPLYPLRNHGGTYHWWLPVHIGLLIPLCFWGEWPTQKKAIQVALRQVILTSNLEKHCYGYVQFRFLWLTEYEVQYHVTKNLCKQTQFDYHTNLFNNSWCSGHNIGSCGGLQIPHHRAETLPKGEGTVGYS